jgi:hypothetical protein
MGRVTSGSNKRRDADFRCRFRHWDLRRDGEDGNQHMALYLTAHPDERTCAIWAEVADRCCRIDFEKPCSRIKWSAIS